MVPKVPNEQKTSNDKEGASAINMEGTSKDNVLNIDRMTGLSAPPGRTPRKKKASSTSATKSKAKAKGKEKAGTTESSDTIGKGKEKEVPTEDVPMDEDAPESNNIDDIYMDE